MNWISLFDGMSCGQMAATSLGLPINKYYASEIELRPIELTKILFPNTIHIGDVRKVDVCLLENIDIIIGGSPCTDLSFAGKRSGMICESLSDYIELRNEYLKTGDEQLYFHNDKFQQSILFWEYLRILRDVQRYNPKVLFFLENVRMDKKYQNMISDCLGIEPQNINSRLVSAQNRNRWYWSNIKTEQKTLFGNPTTSIPIPEDRKLVLKDIVEDSVDEKYYIKNIKEGFDAMSLLSKSKTLRVGGSSSQTNKHNYDLIKVAKDLSVKGDQNKASCITAGGNSGGNHSDMDLICIAQRGRNPENPSSRVPGEYLEQTFEPRTDEKTNCITSVGKDNLIFEYANSDSCICLNYDTAKHQQDRIYHENGKSPSMTASNNDDKRVLVNYRIRRLTPRECLRLQTVPEDIIDKILSSGIKDSPIYKMAGNGWTIDVIVEYFQNIKLNGVESKQDQENKM